MSWRDYDQARAAAYDAERAAPDAQLSEVRAVLVRELAALPGGPVVDVGAGTGLWSDRLRRWVSMPVIAIEPSAAMLRRLADKRLPGVLALRGRAEALPLRRATCAAAWLSTVVHHFDDLEVAAAEVRRVLAPGGVALVRSSFPDQQSGAVYPSRFFPSAGRVAASLPTLEEVTRAFARSGLALERRHAPREVAAATRMEFLSRVESRADSLLREVSDDEFAAGLRNMRRWAEAAPGEPVLFHPDVLVFT
jgi:ubiquinone/menaquinone biosynthesis C-methylase UbiE